MSIIIKDRFCQMAKKELCVVYMLLAENGPKWIPLIDIL